jgi:hypothetical protein
MIFRARHVCPNCRIKQTDIIAKGDRKTPVKRGMKLKSGPTKGEGRCDACGEVYSVKIVYAEDQGKMKFLDFQIGA